MHFTKGSGIIIGEPAQDFVTDLYSAIIAI